MKTVAGSEMSWVSGNNDQDKESKFAMFFGATCFRRVSPPVIAQLIGHITKNAPQSYALA